MSSPKFYQFSFSYFCYFAVVGITVPYLSVYFDSLGFSSREIGELLAVFAAAKILGPTLWANRADKSAAPLPVIRLGAGLSLASFTLMFWVTDYWPIVFVLAMFSLFWTGIQPQLEVMTLSHIYHNAHVYARIRLWGSIGFIITVVVVGELIGRFSPQVFVIIGWLIFAALFVSSLLLRQTRRAQKTTTSSVSILSALAHRNFVLFFIAGLLLQASFGPYYSFFALYLDDLGYSSLQTGSYIALGAVAEIGIFLVAGKFIVRFGCKWLLIIAFALTSLRWWGTGLFADNAILLVILQCLHAASFGLYHSASIQFLSEHFTKKQQNRAQAIYIAGVYGIGGVIGAYVSGLIWQQGVGAEFSYQMAAAASLLSALVAIALTSNKRRRNFQRCFR